MRKDTSYFAVELKLINQLYFNFSKNISKKPKGK